MSYFKLRKFIQIIYLFKYLGAFSLSVSLYFCLSVSLSLSLYLSLSLNHMP